MEDLRKKLQFALDELTEAKKWTDVERVQKILESIIENLD